MNVRQIVTALLVVGLLAPAATAAPTVLDSDASSTNDAVAAQSGDAAAAQSASSSSSSSSATSTTNYTELYVESDYHNLRLKPGETDSFTVSVENGEDEPVDVSPHVYVPPLATDVVKSEWVTIDPADTTLDAGEEQEFNVTVSVPEDADLGYYSGTIAFTNETTSYYGGQERPIHSASFSLDVYKEPTVRIVDGDYAYTQIQTGESYTHTIEIENSGDSSVPVNPEVNTESRYYGGDQQSVEREWISVDAPTEIEAGETGTVNVTVDVPEDASVGNYDFRVDLGLKDPARQDGSDYWQEVDISFQAWEQPDEPYTTTVDVEEDTENLTVTLDTHNRENAESPNFDVTLVSPDGETIDVERVQQSQRGYVDLASDSDGVRPYGGGDSQQTFTYRHADPEAGEWTVEIMPENTVQFGYEIVLDEA
jgi:hypothetical protein